MFAIKDFQIFGVERQVAYLNEPLVSKLPSAFVGYTQRF